MAWQSDTFVTKGGGLVVLCSPMNQCLVLPQLQLSDVVLVL